MAIWSFKTYEYRDDIPVEYDTCLKKRMVVVLSKDDLKTKETKM